MWYLVGVLTEARRQTSWESRRSSGRRTGRVRWTGARRSWADTWESRSTRGSLTLNDGGGEGAGIAQLVLKDVDWKRGHYPAAKSARIVIFMVIAGCWKCLLGVEDERR